MLNGSSSNHRSENVTKWKTYNTARVIYTYHQQQQWKTTEHGWVQTAESKRPNTRTTHIWPVWNVYYAVHIPLQHFITYFMSYSMGQNAEINCQWFSAKLSHLDCNQALLRNRLGKPPLRSPLRPLKIHSISRFWWIQVQCGHMTQQRQFQQGNFKYIFIVKNAYKPPTYLCETPPWIYWKTLKFARFLWNFEKDSNLLELLVLQRISNPYPNSELDAKIVRKPRFSTVLMVHTIETHIVDM